MTMQQVVRAEVALRPARAADGPFLLALFADVRGPLFAAMQVPAAQRRVLLEQQCRAQAQDYRTRFPTSDHHVIEVRDRPVGRIWVDRRTTEIRLLDIALLGTARGAGVGAMLLRDLQEEARASGRRLGHAVENGNLAAFRFYERLGFVTDGPLGHSHTLMVWQP